MSTRRVFLMETVAASALAAQVVQITHAALKHSPAVSGSSITTYAVPESDLVVSRIAYGCADLVPWDKKPLNAETIAKASRVINTAYDQGITFFDLADIYGFWKAEEAFGAVLKQSAALRNKVIIQSKCGSSQHDDPLCNDSSYQHIVSSVEGSLRRLRTDHLDILLLHQPDALAEPANVGMAFEELRRSGKVRYFGVSNYTGTQIELLKTGVKLPLVVNQVPVGLGYPGLIVDSFTGTAGTLDYCRMNNIQVQAYSPLRSNLLNPPPDATLAVKTAAQVLTNLSMEKDTTPAAVMLAWLLHHPARFVPVIGATNPEHIVEDCAADSVSLSREEWYALFSAAMNVDHPQQ